MKKLAIVIPAYNEEKRIGATLKEYGNFFNKLKKERVLDYEILVVINNTQDNTQGIVQQYQKHNRNIKFLNLRPGGKGFAIIQGFKHELGEKNDLIGFVDADASTPASAFYDLVKNIDNYDAIIASRYIKGAIVQPKQTIFRRVASRVFNFLIRTLFLMTYKDTQCGAKIMKSYAVKKIISKLGITQWAFDIDLLYWLEKYNLRVKEHPTRWLDKEASTLNVKKASIQMFLSIIQLRVVHSPLKRILSPFKPIIGIIWRLAKKLK
jgi:glycosyltransferase involved in cell wall biosynthesis